MSETDKGRPLPGQSSKAPEGINNNVNLSFPWEMPNQSFAQSCWLTWSEIKDEWDGITAKPDCVWHCCVLWDRDIMKELDEHLNKWNCKRYSKILVAEMLCKSVIDQNPEMTWEKPFMLLQLVGNSCFQREDDEDDYIIRVAEFSTANNCHIPELDRMYDLVLPDYLDNACIAKEITRLPELLNVIIIWNYDLIEVPSSESAPKIRGQIYLREPTTNSIPSILIFHGELMTRHRVVQIQCLFEDSELEHFNKPGIGEITRRKMLSKDGDRLAVHFSRHYRIAPCDGSRVPQISFEGFPTSRSVEGTRADFEESELNLLLTQNLDPIDPDPKFLVEIESEEESSQRYNFSQLIKEL